MIIRSLAVIFIVLGASTLAFAQRENLLKNPSGDEYSQHWRAFGNAKVETCVGGGPCFVLRDGGYFIQDVSVSENTVGQYALLIGRARSERTNADGSITGRPSLHGYMMNAGDPSGGRIYAYLGGQKMMSTDGDQTFWRYLWGVFRIQPGTMRIRLFLNQALARSVPHDGSRTSFDDLGVYIFPTEQEALAYVAQITPIIQAGARKHLYPIPQCPYQRASISPLYGIQLGMSLEEIVSVLPGIADSPHVQKALETFRSSNSIRITRLVIDNHTNNPELREVRQIFLQFRDKRLSSFSFHSSSPRWESVDKFIEQRGHLLNLIGVNWIPVEGNAQAGKYLICDGVEISFYASPERSSNLNYISVSDVAAEAKAVQAVTQSVRP